MKTTVTSVQNKPALIGLALLTFPILFWIAVTLEQLFHNEFLQENLVMKIDHASSLLSILLFIVFPLIALLINLFYITRFSSYKENTEWVTMLSFRPQTANLSIIIFSAVNILILFGYSITENFIITAR
ncbi:MAG TPA: hypothetical protein VJY62_18835 [Bacteroidia bacterium]|nr:hypothetical protein [Bacteroidia bacterium]